MLFTLFPHQPHMVGQAAAINLNMSRLSTWHQGINHWTNVQQRQKEFSTFLFFETFLESMGLMLKLQCAKMTEIMSYFFPVKLSFKSIGFTLKYQMCKDDTKGAFLLVVYSLSPVIYLK
jgi:hypothetical protein